MPGRSPKPRLSALAVGVAATLTGCGRILLELGPDPARLEVPDAGPDAGPTQADASLPPRDAGGVADGSLDAAPMPDVGPSTSDAANTPDAQADTGSASCNLSGTWAARFDVPLSWTGALLQSGSGTLRAWALVEITHTGASLEAQALPCGVEVPSFALNPLVANETYGVNYPLAAFDAQPPSLSAASIQGSTSGALPNLSASMGSFAFTLGVALADPVADPWPAAASLVSTDPDADGRPAITVDYTSGSGYAFPPVDFARATRASTSDLAARVRLTAELRTSDCEGASGTGPVTAFDTHILGCRVAGSGANCDGAQRDFLDAQRPNYSAGTSDVQMARLTAGSLCADARASLP